tara:strand:- start:689 stop:1324 length:636 start_codon:yes stop_codon:yes gene_type:complete
MNKKINIGIIDYGINNIISVKNAFDLLECETRVIYSNSEKYDFDALVLPGVGAFGEAIESLCNHGLNELIKENTIIKKKPFLGICLGMQLMANDSIEKGYNKGLSLIDGNVIKIKSSAELRVPHIGWNNIEFKNESEIFKNIKNDSNFYFVHSYHFTCSNDYIIGKVNYGSQIVAAIQKENLFGVQFHPERSQKIGLELLNNFKNIIYQYA